MSEVCVQLAASISLPPWLSRLCFQSNPQLEVVRLGCFELESSIADVLQQLPNVRELELEGLVTGPSAIAAFRKLRHLKRFRLAALSAANNPEVAILKTLQSHRVRLERLAVCGDFAVNDEMIDTVCALNSNLTQLRLPFLSDAGLLRAIDELKHLTCVYIEGPDTFRGIRNALRSGQLTAARFKLDDYTRQPSVALDVRVLDEIDALRRDECVALRTRMVIVRENGPIYAVSGALIGMHGESSE